MVAVAVALLSTPLHPLTHALTLTPSPTHSHWHTHARSYRYDYEGLSSEDANKVIAHLESLVADESFAGKEFEQGFKLKTCDNFEYTDVTNNEVTSKQGLRFIFEDNSRIVFRLSGTGSSGATLRMYIDSYQGDRKLCEVESQEALKPLVQLAINLAKIEEFTGRKEPTVIT